MFSQLRRVITGSRVVARLSTTLLLTCALLVLSPPESARGQSCQQGGAPLCGPACHAYYNIIWDPAFSQTSCSAWQFDPQAERVLTGYYCTGWPAPYARFNGPSQWWDVIHQTTQALPQPGRDHFEFTYTYEINDPLNNPYTMLEVWIYQGNWWYLVETAPAGSQACQTRTVDLGRHPEWLGQQLEVHFWAYQPGNSNINIGPVALWQTSL